MASISLRAYNQEIEDLIERGQNDEAIAHCTHILQSVPKHIGTYRLLGQALLEKNQYSDATDIFQRVLSSIPDDFVAHVGMSIISENAKNLDHAIWHMERAYETQPANAAIQDELRRLYGRRDGLEPPKIRLTRGELARMYAKGNLHQQAIGELQAALVDDQQRPDLLVLLAQMYHESGQREQAVNVCSDLIKTLPFCFQANRILADLLANDKSVDSERYFQRLVSLDPYYSHIDSKHTSSDLVPDNLVMVDKASYQVGQAGTPALAVSTDPEWAAELGAAFQDDGPEALPDWVTTESDETIISQASSDTFSESHGDDINWDESEDEQALGPEEGSDDNLPDFLANAGWSPSDRTADEIAMEEMQTAEEAEDDLTPADIPDWLKQMAPDGALQQEDLLDETTDEDVLPWLQESEPGPTDSVVTWLEEQKEPASEDELEELEAALQEASIPSEGDFASGEAVEAVSVGAAPLDEEPVESSGSDLEWDLDEDLPDWLKSSETERSGITDDLPGWLSGEGEIPEITSIEEAAELEVTDLQEPVETEIETSVGEAAFAPTTESAISDEPIPDLPSWLDEDDDTLVPEMPSDWVEEVEDTPGEEIPEAETDLESVDSQLDELPAWLQDDEEVEVELASAMDEEPEEIEAEGIVTRDLFSSLSEPDEEMSDWLQEEDEGIPETAEPEPMVEEEPILSDEVLPLDEPEGETEGVFEEELEEVPAGEVELPDWLSESFEEQPEAEKVIEDTAPWSIPTEEEPEEQLDIAESVEEEIPLELEPAAELPTASSDLDLDDPDTALAWLEGLAAQQGAAEEQLTTRSEDRPETPDWLKASALAANETGELPTYKPTETVEGFDEGTLAWEEPAEEPMGKTVDETVEALEVDAVPVEELSAELEDLIGEVEAELEFASEADLELPADDLVSADEALPEMELEEETEGVLDSEVELPDWLSEPLEEQPEVEAEIEETAIWSIPTEAEPEEMELASESLTDEIPLELEPAAELPGDLDLDDPDAALAWLEGLAAQQGADEGQLTTSSEDRPKTPEWLKESALAADESGELPTYQPTETVEGLVEEGTLAWEEPADKAVVEPADEAVEALEVEAVPAEELPAELAETLVAGEQPVEEMEEGVAAPEKDDVWEPVLESEEPADDYLGEDLDMLEELEEELTEALAVSAEKEAEDDLSEIELPDWLADMDSELEDVEPEAVTESIEDTQPTMLKELAEDALAEESFVAEASDAGIPDWLKEPESEAEEIQLTETPTEEEFEEVPEEEPVEWMLESELAQETTEPSLDEEIPAWLRDDSVEEEPMPVTGPLVSDEEEDIPDWILEPEFEEEPEEDTWEPDLAEMPTQISQQEQVELIDLNSASLSELESLPGIGFIFAQNIINYREENGPFESIDQLENVQGIDPALVDQLREHVEAYTEPTAPEIEVPMVEPTDEDEKKLFEGINALKDNDYETGLEKFKSLIKENLMLTEVIENLQVALADHQDEYNLWDCLGDAYMRDNQLQAALEAYNQAEELIG